MIVSPELMSASSSPSARPLKSCETKLPQVIKGAPGTKRASRSGPGCPFFKTRSGVVAQLAAELVRLLHERRPRDDLHHRPEVLLVLHLGLLLALHDDHRAHQLVVFLAEVHLADGRLQLAALLVGL